MNTEVSYEKNPALSTGECLRNAREQLGLTQQFVAKKLCLKVSMVRDIEQDKAADNLASTFLRGYIRSYAKLVHLPEDELLLMIERRQPSSIPTMKVSTIPPFLLSKHPRGGDRWLMIFTWLVFLIAVGLTGAWWWENHRAQRNEMMSIVDQYSTNRKNIPEKVQNVIPLDIDNSSKISDFPKIEENQLSRSVDSVNSTSSSQNTPSKIIEEKDTPPLFSSPKHINMNGITSDIDLSANLLSSYQADVPPIPVNLNELVMNFTADCWLEVIDAKGEKLFSGLQHKNERLHLSGYTPYKLTIGAPSAVKIYFQGKPVNLKSFVQNNQVAHITIDSG